MKRINLKNLKMEYKKPTEQNILKYTIEKQLQKDQVSLKNSVQSKSYTLVPEIKYGNIFNNWLSKLIGKNKESGLIIAQQRTIEQQNKEKKTPKALSEKSAQSQLKISQKVPEIKFDKFQQVVPPSQKNKAATLSASKSNEVSTKLPLPVSKLLHTFQGKIQETKQGLQKGVVGDNQFPIKIQETTKILKNILNLVNPFQGKIQEKSKDLSKVPQVKDLKETLTKKTTKNLDPKVDIAIKNKNTTEQMKAAESQKDETKQSSRVLVTLSTNSDGDITNLNIFTIAQPSARALQKNHSATTILPKVRREAVKKGRSLGDDYGRITLSRGG